MGGLFQQQPQGGGGGTTPGANQTTGGFTASDAPAGKGVSSGGFIDDGAKRMPSSKDAIYAENLRKIRQQLSARSGRASTNLAGTRAFVNNFLGGTQ